MEWTGASYATKKGIDIIATLIKSDTSFIHVTNKCQGWRSLPGRLLIILKSYILGYID